MAPIYLDHFGLTAAPFSPAPDPGYLYLSAGHREALAHFLYGLQSDDGVVVLSGDVGCGKTTLCHCLLEQLPDNCDVVLISNPKISALELLASICEEFQIALPATEASVKTYIDRLHAHLLDTHERGRHSVLIVDEAQSLSPEVFEQIRLLTNLETSRSKLLHVVLTGQPSLRELLARPDMQQFAQRIAARCHLGPLSRADAQAYVVHRLAVAGTRRELFSEAALDRLYRLSEGVPRRLNALADRALLGAYAQGAEQVTAPTVSQAGEEVMGLAPATRAARKGLPRAAVMGLGAVCGAAALTAAYFYYDGAALARPVGLFAK